MAELRTQDFRALNASTLILHDRGLHETFTTKLQAALAPLIASDVTALECFDSRLSWTGRMFADPEQQVARLFHIFLQEKLSHPLFPLFASGKLRDPVRISDIQSLSKLRGSQIYSEFLKPLGIERQIAVTLRLDDGLSGVLVLGRWSKDFSGSERERLKAFVPHIEMERRAMPRSGQLTPKINLGVTEREAEVLRWLAHGKSDEQISIICKMSKRTVQKHCENLYRKLGVECRTAAVVRALTAEMKTD
ncbi:helix-turn-helix transcriptional regulator [Edaphobacter albus]|uniref:helix-turn-helix transcriptional regulator n=1 Tax=Edaphobacter sp. 4G125 TaxID=2763071 RepID=UPI0016472815|nr:helix-turn-helix transcriptional regulator [Edaphobacter sp. 4G125]QNI36200.1 hypothetical protein H7846_14600 [Edaphobacter sp. 4G125]